MKKLLLTLMLLTGCTANNNITNTSSAVVVVDEEKRLVEKYIKDIVRCYEWEYYAYTYQKLEGKYNLSGTKNHYLITVYTERDTGYEKLEFLCWESIIDYELEWEKVDYDY